jgi:hypothetical protein
MSEHKDVRFVRWSSRAQRLASSNWTKITSSWEDQAIKCNTQSKRTMYMKSSSEIGRCLMEMDEVK